MTSNSSITPEEQFMTLHKEIVAGRSRLTAKEIENTFQELTEQFGQAPFHQQFSQWIKRYFPGSSD